MLYYIIALFLLSTFIYSFIVTKALSYLFRSNRKVLSMGSFFLALYSIVCLARSLGNPWDPASIESTSSSTHTIPGHSCSLEKGGVHVSKGGVRVSQAKKKPKEKKPKEKKREQKTEKVKTEKNRKRNSQQRKSQKRKKTQRKKTPRKKTPIKSQQRKKLNREKAKREKDTERKDTES